MRPVILLALLLVVPLASAALPAPVPVVASGFHFLPPALVIPAGTTVSWINGALPHTVTTSDDVVKAATGVANDRANSDGNPDTFHGIPPMSHRFDNPGTFSYFCELHFRLGMIGTVTVV